MPTITLSHQELTTLSDALKARIEAASACRDSALINCNILATQLITSDLEQAQALQARLTPLVEN